MKQRRILALFLALVISVTALTVNVSAASSDVVKTDKSGVSAGRVWNGTSDTSWYDENKTEFKISTPEQLAGLARLVNGGHDLMAGKKFVLTNDIYLNDQTNCDNWATNPPKNEWTPIADGQGDPINGYRPFCGVFDGNGYSIYGLYINSYCRDKFMEANVGCDRAGLFGFTYGAVIGNLGLRDGYVKATKVGQYAMRVGSLIGTCESSYISGCYSDVDVECYYASGDGMWSHAYAGGLIGEMGKENFSDVAIMATIFAGGYLLNPAIVNYAPDGGMFPTSYVVDCMYAGDVKATCNGMSHACASGIVANSVNSEIVHCYETGTHKASGGSAYETALIGEALGYTVDKCFIKKPASGEGFGVIGKNNVSLTLVQKYNSTLVDEDKINSDATLKKLGKGYHKENGVIVPAKIKAPTVRVALEGYSAALSWEPVANTKSYTVYNGDKKLATVDKPKAVLENIKGGKSYKLVIKATLKNGKTKEVTNGKFTLTIPKYSDNLFPGATPLKPLETVSEEATDGKTVRYFKIDLESDGKIAFDCYFVGTIMMSLFDKNNNTVIEEMQIPGDVDTKWYNINEGTYYLKLTNESANHYYHDFFYKFLPDDRPRVFLNITMKKGETLDLGSIKKDFDGTLKWESGDPSIVTVSKGKVKALKAGSTVIKLNYGDESLSIMISVTK